MNQNSDLKVLIFSYLKLSFLGLIIPFTLFFIYNDNNYLKGAILGISLSILQIYLNILKVNWIITKSSIYKNKRFIFPWLTLIVFLMWFVFIYLTILFWKIQVLLVVLLFLFIQKINYYVVFIKTTNQKKGENK